MAKQRRRKEKRKRRREKWSRGEEMKRHEKKSGA